jgi:hypothetical protein
VLAVGLHPELGGRVKIAAFAAGFVLAIPVVGRAVDQEFPGQVAIGAPLMVEDATYQGKGVHWWARRAVQARKDANARGRTIRRLRHELELSAYQPSAPLAIRAVFGRHAEQALTVAWCESRWSTGARNGQYLGLFQMGSFARSRYGHGGDALTQARAAYAYFVDSGRDWSPWSCKP